jgi:hypothetical protein
VHDLIDCIPSRTAQEYQPWIEHLSNNLIAKPCGAQLPTYLGPWGRPVGGGVFCAAYRPPSGRPPRQFEARSCKGICDGQCRRRENGSCAAAFGAHEGPHEALLSVQWPLRAGPASARFQAVLLNPMPRPIQNGCRTYHNPHQGMDAFPLPRPVRATHSRAGLPSAGYGALAAIDSLRL